LDALDAVSDDSDDSASASEHEEEASEMQQQQHAAKKQKVITVEDLQKLGYQTGPSVLYMKPPEEAAEGNWTW
jgi:hypothetical protein